MTPVILHRLMYSMTVALEMEECKADNSEVLTMGTNANKLKLLVVVCACDGLQHS